VTQADGSIQEYPGASIDYAKDAKALTITTADGKGKLTIANAACSYVDQLYRCLLTSASLTQGGSTKTLDFETGTIYANLTSDKQTLPLSSTSLPPGGIVMSLKTKAGTYISLTGTIDSGEPGK
jgi:hypothetical protein